VNPLFVFPPEKKQIGAFIQRRRRELGLTQERLSEMIDCSLRHLVNIERGINGVSIEILLKLCDALRVTPNEILLPQKETDCPDLAWLTEALKHLSPPQRKTAVAILSPYILYAQKIEE